MEGKKEGLDYVHVYIIFVRSGELRENRVKYVPIVLSG